MSDPSSDNGKAEETLFTGKVFRGKLVIEEWDAAKTHPLLRAAQKINTRDYTSHVTDEQRNDSKAALSDLIAIGEVDCGPPTRHEPITEDVRDMRDPEQLASMMERARNGRSDCQTLVHAQDTLERMGARFPLFVDRPIDHAKSYRQELEDRAAEGDKYAESLLRGESLAEEPVD